ncbi:hypothetical protein GGS23DRAFT_241463 [Durotheca rogersii]|uniref:uncharacterized protein n=1 Tax=Durotheca rogersii TaxID=419775 RepID=UPI00221FD199|nr:uncharacterized protein GGS23DRAFT_241463 [Durotheca rogersii]KAI5860251.1 hypothetical protein GGS23DRAFT_241463 [Durotheca rogersii]
MSSAASHATSSRPPASGAFGWLPIPAPLARLFKRFPLLTYPPNQLPARCPSPRNVATLYVFLSDRDALDGLPSYNPSCLRWQTFLKLAGVEFRVVSSNNHASPTGALPFLLPPLDPGNAAAHPPVPSNKLEQYAAERGASKVPDVPNPKLEAYESLLDFRIRNAWLYSLYLSRPNVDLLSRLYIAPVSKSRAVRTAVLYQLRHAAENEILRSMGVPAVDSRTLYAGAREAFEALSIVLGLEHWFFGASGPSLFDATVFSYTHLLLDDGLAWQDRRLVEIVKQFPNLVAHQGRIWQKFWGTTR